MIFAQEQVATKEWQEITNCENIAQISNNQIWGMQDNSNCYIYATTKVLYQFTPDQLSEKCSFTNMSPTNKPLILEECLYYPYSFNNGDNLYNIIAPKFLSGDQKNGYMAINLGIGTGSYVIMNNEWYFLSQNASGMLYKLKLTDKENDNGSITKIGENPLTYSPAENTPIIAVNNIVYYFSTDGLYYVSISNSKEPDNQKIDVVTTTDATSSLVTDNKDRIWIINDSDGVIEYNIQKNTASTIAMYPPSTRDNRLDIFKKACFYLENNLYYIDNSSSDAKVFSLDVTPQEDPDKPEPKPEPDKPTKTHDQSGHTCGCMGLEFILTLAILSLCLRRRH